MWPTIALLVVLVAIFVLITVTNARVVRRVVRERAREHREAASYIERTGNVPPAWLKGRLAALDGAGKRQRFRESMLRRLHDLRRYCEQSPEFDSEEARGSVLYHLDRARDRWETDEVDSMIGPVDS